MFIAVSALGGALYCKRKVFFDYVLKVKEAPKQALVKGTIRHDTHDKIKKQEEKIIKNIEKGFDYEKIYRLYVENYSKALKKSIILNRLKLKSVNIPLTDAYKEMLPRITKQCQLRAHSISQFKEKTGYSGIDLWNNLFPKIRSEVRVCSKELKLRGMIDQLEIYPGGLVPLELKTGKMPKKGVWGSHRIQLAAYALLLEEKYKANIKEGFIIYLDHLEKRQLVFNPFSRQEVLDTRDDIINMIETKNIPDFCDNQNKCASCGLKDICHNKEKLKQLLSNHSI